MRNLLSIRLFPVIGLCFVAPLSGQNPAAPDLVTALTRPGGPAAPGIDEAPIRGASDGAINTRRDARTITLRIPGPRGLIVDREGEPLAQNRVAYQVALQYSQFENADRDFVVNWGRTRIDALQEIHPRVLAVTDDELHDHYTHRRWLPLLVTGQMSEKEARELQSQLVSGIILHPVYQRYYPHGELAAHLIGYTGSVGKLPTGPINFNEPMWEESEGRAGFELLFNDQLTGEPGIKKLLFDENGNRLLEDQTRRPRPGGTVVSTINLKWQKLAETTLRNGSRRGAIVVIDAITGEVLVMASRPSFDLNMFIPGISKTDLEALEKDPGAPLYGRAFQSAYPPASTFKSFVALAALSNGDITPTTAINSPASMTFGRHTMWNANKSAAGSINVHSALAASVNTWFYQVGIRTGAHSFLGLSRRFGFGERTGLPLVGETAGLVPNDDYMMRAHKRRILQGDTANLSIGQGDLLASPLQVAQAMAGIANGTALPKLQLIRQVQDSRGRVIQAPLPERKSWLGVDEKAVDAVRKGMADCISHGTGRGAALSYTSNCGKTGTAQWGDPRRKQRLAWFAGFLPRDNPRYAYAVLYEGRPGETVYGGRNAAPMVKRFFEGIKDDIKDEIAPPKRALVVIDEDEGIVAEPGEEPPALDEDAPLEEGEIRNPSGVEPLRALPVEPLVADFEEGEVIDDEFAPPPPLETRPARALPVGEDEIIEDFIVEP